MIKPEHARRRWQMWGSALVLMAILGAALVVGGSIITGNGLHLKTFIRSLPNLARVLAHHQAVINENIGEYRNVIFLHHSVGANLIKQGQVRERLSEHGLQFWDHDYNWLGLSDPSGKLTGYHYNVPHDNTDPDGLLQIFTQPVYALPINTLSALLQHEVIAFKSCFPASNIVSDAQLQEREDWYLKIRETIDRHPDRLFIVVTQPPLNPAETTPEAAARARAFANWLKSDEYLAGRLNVATFDLFDLLAENDPRAPDFNMLRADYREGTDSHPNRLANETIGPLFAEFIVQEADRQHSAEQ